MPLLVRFTGACAATAALLWGASAVSVEPHVWGFSLSNIAGNTTDLEVPEGMFWVVEQVTGYYAASTYEVGGLPVISLGQEQGSTSLYLSPSQISVNTPESGPPSLFADYSRSVVARFSGNVVARNSQSNPRSGGSVYIAVSGYLTPTLGGDFNGDSIVDAADYTTYRDNPGYWASGDYQDWSIGYGSTGGGRSVVVPEPAAAVLLLLGTVAVLSQQRL